MNMRLLVFVVIFCAFIMSISSDAYSKTAQSGSQRNEFDKVFNSAPLSGGVKEINYAQFITIKNSGEKFFLIDVLSEYDYKTGHIDGAISMPIRTINESTVKKVIPSGARVIVYCNGFECHASSQAARQLSGYGYKVLDYKGGLQDWTAHGGRLVK